MQGWSCNCDSVAISQREVAEDEEMKSEEMKELTARVKGRDPTLLKGEMVVSIS